MRELFRFNGMVTQIGIMAIFANVCIVSDQTADKHQYAIPENVNEIFQASCIPCHGDKGGRFPTSKLKFSRWAGYGTTKQFEKAQQICSEVRKGKMPPKSFRESDPELVPTKEQIDLICKWAESVKSEKEEK